MILETIFNYIKTINNRVANIHYGGCGIFANEAYHLLCALGYKPKIIVVSSTIPAVKAWISGEIRKHNQYDMYLCVTHIVIELDGQYIDNNGVYDDTNDVKHCQGIETIEIPYETLDNWVTNIKDWNMCFDRRKIPLIKKKFEMCLNKLTKAKKKVAKKIVISENNTIFVAQTN